MGQFNTDTNAYSRAGGRWAYEEKEWDILTNESWSSGCFLRCWVCFFFYFEPHHRDFCRSIDKRVILEINSWWSSSQRAEMKIEVNLCSIISSLSYLWSCFSLQLLVWWYLLTIVFVLFGGIFIDVLKCTEPRCGGSREVDWTKPSSAAKRKMKKNIPLASKVYLPTKRRK